MPPAVSRLLRIVIQHHLESDVSMYRFVAYGDGTVYRPLEFSSRIDLVRVVRSLLPQFREGLLPAQLNPRGVEIIFTADVLVDDTQIQHSGLRSGA